MALRLSSPVVRRGVPPRYRLQSAGRGCGTFCVIGADASYTLPDGLVAPGAVLERLAGGFGFTEGPVWIRDERALHFSDIPASRRYRWHPTEGVDVVRDPNDKGNGMTVDVEGNLLVCHHATSTLVRERADGTREVVASHWQGRELNSPNDVVVRSDGTIYFTDPTYGRHAAAYGVPREQELDFQGVYRVAPGGGLHLEVGDFALPNGLCLSPDETLLYVNDTAHSHIRVFDVEEDGALGKGRPFFAIGSSVPGEEVDGMKCDEHGAVYVTGPGGIWAISPQGRLLGTIAVPETVGNLAWGGHDGRTLFVCASTSLYALRMAVRGSGVAARP
jgi:gluconolactonase